jgi:hypothetical protein
MAENMVRTQVYLSHEIYEKLQARADRHGLTMAVQVRTALEDYLERVESEEEGTLRADDPLFQLIGAAASEEGDLSVNHDHYLYGWPKRETSEASVEAPAKERPAAYRAKRKKSPARRREK